jgi:hypothetical protein
MRQEEEQEEGEKDMVKGSLERLEKQRRLDIQKDIKI